MKELKIFILILPAIVILIADRPITHIANEVISTKTFEIGLIVMVLDVILILIVVCLSFYTIKKIWKVL